MEKEFLLPLPNKYGEIEELKCRTSLVFIGANGSGKTRLGVWLELNSINGLIVHRISAQKSLAMPNSTTPTSLASAERDLIFGHANSSGNLNDLRNAKLHNRWAAKPATSMLDDFSKLMVYLFSEHTEEAAKYLIASKQSSEKITPPTTKLDNVKLIWEKILPHRELIIGGLTINTTFKNDNNKIYNSSDMSDGERVVFYLIGQCLAATKDCIILIDEPETHLHKSIQNILWSEIEKLRPDCLFIYLTHDVDFAAAQEGAQRIWLKSFDGTNWDWELITPDQNLPDDLLLEVLGSRKPILFVEGENGSFDVSLYREVLPKFLVIPRGSCNQVIQSVKAFKANAQLHNLAVYGIIDRDRRVEAEIVALEQESIFVLQVAEVENLFCTKEILQIISLRLARNVEDDLQAISTTIFSRLQSELETQISLRVASEIKFQLNNFNENAKGSVALNAALASLATNIDVNTIYETNRIEFERILTIRDYNALLRLYNRKSLLSQVSGALGLKNNELPELILRLARGDSSEEIRNAVKPYFGNFSALM